MEDEELETVAVFRGEGVEGLAEVYTAFFAILDGYAASVNFNGEERRLNLLVDSSTRS